MYTTRRRSLLRTEGEYIIFLAVGGVLPYRIVHLRPHLNAPRLQLPQVVELNFYTPAAMVAISMS